MDADGVAVFVDGGLLLVLEEFSLHDAGLSFVGKTFGVEEFRIGGLDLDGSVEVCTRLVEPFEAKEDVTSVVEDVWVRVPAEALAVLLLDVRLALVVILVALVWVLAWVGIVRLDSDRSIEILQGLIIEAHMVVCKTSVIVVHRNLRVTDFNRLLEVLLSLRKIPMLKV